MNSENKYFFVSKSVVAIVDFLKWTSTFGEDSLRQVEMPMPGARIAPMHTHLFGLAEDDLGLMFTMQHDEAPWLADLPIAAALRASGDSLLLITQEITAFDRTLPAVCVEIYVPPTSFAKLKTESLLGFCLTDGINSKRVNRMVSLQDRESLGPRERASTVQSTSLFSAK